MILDLLVVLAIFAFGLAVAGALASRCPRCRRWFALRTTGNRRELTKKGVKYDDTELRCLRCHHHFWRSARREAGGSMSG